MVVVAFWASSILLRNNYLNVSSQIGYLWAIKT
jgi:hypothetical protein